MDNRVLQGLRGDVFNFGGKVAGLVPADRPQRAAVRPTPEPEADVALPLSSTSEIQATARSVADEADPFNLPARSRNVAKKWQSHAMKSRKDSGPFALSPFAV